MRLILVAVLLCLISASRPAAAAKPDVEETVPLQYVNEDVHAVILLYEKLTGFKIVRDNFVQGKITVTTDQPVSRATRSSSSRRP